MSTGSDGPGFIDGKPWIKGAPVFGSGLGCPCDNSCTELDYKHPGLKASCHSLGGFFDIFQRPDPECEDVEPPLVVKRQYWVAVSVLPLPAGSLISETDWIPLPKGLEPQDIELSDYQHTRPWLGEPVPCNPDRALVSPSCVVGKQRQGQFTNQAPQLGCHPPVCDYPGTLHDFLCGLPDLIDIVWAHVLQVVGFAVCVEFDDGCCVCDTTVCVPGEECAKEDPINYPLCCDAPETCPDPECCEDCPDTECCLTCGQVDGAADPTLSVEIMEAPPSSLPGCNPVPELCSAPENYIERLAWQVRATACDPGPPCPGKDAKIDRIVIYVVGCESNLGPNPSDCFDKCGPPIAPAVFPCLTHHGEPIDKCSPYEMNPGQGCAEMIALFVGCESRCQPTAFPVNAPLEIVVGAVTDSGCVTYYLYTLDEGCPDD